MSSRRRHSSVLANPVLVGAVTVLVVTVAVFLAYNANNGLPFVPTTQLKVQTASGANLVDGNEVRAGGFRVGVVESMRPIRLPDGRVGAELTLKLDQTIGDIPADSRAVIRPRSALGLKYVELTKGDAAEVIRDGGTLPVEQTSATAEVDDLYSTFDEDTRRGSRQNLEGFGDVLAGRGTDLNDTIREAPEFLRLLRPVMANLADPRTELDDFFRELGDAARIVAPVAVEQARLFTTMADTFEAFSRDPEALEQTIARNPDTLAVGERSLRRQRPFLTDLAGFSRELEAAAEELPPTLPAVNAALETGTPVTRRSVELSDELRGTLAALTDVASAPGTNAALRGLTATVTTLQPQLRFLGPYVTVCNYWNTFWTFVAEHFTAPDPTGSAQRALLNSGAPQDDSVTSMGANEFATGRNVKEPGGVEQHVHQAFLGRAIEADGRANCQGGQQGYLHSANRYGDPFYERAVVDPVPEDAQGNVGFIPADNVGPTYDTYDKQGQGQGRGPARVPEGQTFTVHPGGKGAQLDP